MFTDENNSQFINKGESHIDLDLVHEKRKEFNYKTDINTMPENDNCEEQKEFAKTHGYSLWNVKNKCINWDLAGISRPLFYIGM